MRLGDAVATFVQPIARGIDSVLGTDLEHCAGCAGRQQRLNQVSDQLFALLSRRAQDNDTSPMDYTVTKQTTAQFVIIGANTPEEAIEKAQKGEGQQSQGGQSWSATVRQGQGNPPGSVMGQAAALGIPHGR